MAFFNLTDIKIKDSKRNFESQSRFGTSILRYPLDIGSLDKGHYMIIHINKQIKSRFKTGIDTENIPTIFQNQNQNGSYGLSVVGPNISRISGDTAALEFVQNGINQASTLGNRIKAEANDLEEGLTKELTEKALSGGIALFQGMKNTGIEYFNLLGQGKGLRTIERTTDSIALYMPDTLNFSNNQQYSTMEFGSSPLAYLNAAAAGYSNIKDIEGNTPKLTAFTQNITPFILNRLSNRLLGNVGTGLFAAASGSVLNPQLEMIYTSPSFREFRFDFMLYPRSSQEAYEVQLILSRLRFHQAPEIYKEGAGALGGFFLVPPSEFDIEFYYNGRINPNIPKISTCVLTSIDTDYAPNGWAAYEVPGDAGEPLLGSTGMPVGIRLSLNFQETEIMTKDNFPRDDVTAQLSRMTDAISIPRNLG